MLQDISEQLSQEQKLQLERFADQVTRMGGNFSVCDAEGRIIINYSCGRFTTDWEAIIESYLLEFETCARKDDRELSVIDERVWAGVLSWESCRPEYIAFIDRGQVPVKKDSQIGNASNISFGEDKELHTYEILYEMFSLLVHKFNWETKALRQAEKFTVELSQVYEELALIHKLSANMRVNSTDANYLQLACDSLTEIVSVEGIAILLEQSVDNENCLVLTAGSGLVDIDLQMATILRSRVASEIAKGNEALLDSAVDAPFKYNWPEYIRSIIVVPLFGKERMRLSDRGEADNYIIGIMVGINRLDKDDFDSADLKLFNSVANGCAVFVENVRLFRDLQELFLGSLKALTSSIDAKDQYTRGHSERVAIIAQWIAQRYAEQEHLEAEQIHNIYLAGLLHDVGKIGIDESVLKKNGRLTVQEYDCIKRHPVIGASILSEIKQMRDIVPGVLHHHERLDGAGYPHGLKGDSIPLSGKIVGLADSFDAMTSARLYRAAMTCEQALGEIKKGLGTQFDEKVGMIFLNSDINHLWQIIQNQTSEAYGIKSVSVYDSQALETLAR